MAKSFLDQLIDSIFDADWIGRRGEKLTERELKLVKFFGRGGKILRNVYVPKRNGETSEVDVLFITQKGIFVIESKNYSGWIFGNEKNLYWTVTLPNRIHNKFYNPVMQNRTHIKWLGQYLDEKVSFFSIIAFSNRCDLKKITMESSDIYVINRDRIYATVRNIWDKSPDCLSETQIASIYEKLKVLTDVDMSVKQAHIASINQRYGKNSKESNQKNTQNVWNKAKPSDLGLQAVDEDAITRELEEMKVRLGIHQSAAVENNKEKEQPQDMEKYVQTPESKELNEQMQDEKESDGTEQDHNDAVNIINEGGGICPRCGGQLLLRTAKKGKNVGKQFYGCSNFPKCRYLKS